MLNKLDLGILWRGLDKRKVVLQSLELMRVDFFHVKIDFVSTLYPTSNKCIMKIELFFSVLYCVKKKKNKRFKMTLKRYRKNACTYWFSPHWMNLEICNTYKLYCIYYNDVLLHFHNYIQIYNKCTLPQRALQFQPRHLEKLKGSVF